MGDAVVTMGCSVSCTALEGCSHPSLCPIGIPPAHLQRYSHLGCIDVNAFRELLAPVLPAQEAELPPSEEEPSPQSPVLALHRTQTEETGPGGPPLEQGRDEPADPALGAVLLDESGHRGEHPAS